MNSFDTNPARLRLAFDRWGALLTGRPQRERILATICWKFPIYSQTFVYEELVQMLASDFDLRVLYSELEGREHLPSAFGALWERKRHTALDPHTAARDVAYFRRRMPGKVETLVAQLCAASGFSVEQLTNDSHFQMAFSYARLAEAYRPHYLHSYFFYEGTLFTLVASQLLGIPRGVSCYADHMLQDFPLKLVSFHLETCDVVVATSERIGQELAALHPRAETGNILVKPNAIDTTRFPQVERTKPQGNEPFRLVCVARLEPKKGLLDLIEAMRLLLDRGIRVELDLVGANDESPSGLAYRAQLQERITARRLQDAVVLQGRRSPAEVLDFVHQAHVFVAPFIETDAGDKDGIPTALLEGMSTGAAIVATDAGSITEPITAGVNGIIVAQRNPVALAQAIAELLADPARRDRLGEQAARTARERYDVRHCDRMLHERIRHVLALRKAGAYK